MVVHFRAIDFTMLLFITIFIYMPADAQKKSSQPTIITKEGSIIFQSAMNGNISFVLNGDESDVTLAGTSVKELIQTVETQKSQIEVLKNEAGPCSKTNPCGNNGVCVNVNKQVSQNLYKCVCQAGFTGAACSQLDLCAGVTCLNSGQCSVVAGRGVCMCADKWFGVTCAIPKPTECKYKVMEKSRFISSPGYPNGYPSNADCSWEITTTPGSIVKLVVMETIMGDMTTKCITDYLEILDGLSTSTKVLGTLCGSIAAKTIYSESNKMTLKLKTGNIPMGNGFIFFYSEETNDKCGGRLTKPMGSIRSINDTNIKIPCIWVIDTNSKEKLTLKIDTLKITNEGGRCDNYLEVRTGDSDDSPLFEKICSRNTIPSSPLVMKTESPKLFIKLVRKDIMKGDMINAMYDTECGGIIDLRVGDKISFASPFYPNYYPSKKRCKWVFHAPPSNFLNLRFFDFMLDGHKTCDNDQVIVRTGSRSGVYRFCGGQLPFPVTSSTNRMDIEFTTDGDQNFRGFQAEIMAVDGRCTKTLRGRFGTVSSPFYPSYYPENSECVYTIVAGDKERAVQLTFSVFNIESNSTCDQDYIQIFDGDSVNAPIKYSSIHKNGRLCGTQIPPITVSSGQTLTVKFKSDGSTSNVGFSADWTTIRKSTECNVQKTEGTGQISSPSYPSSYSDNRDCNITIKASENHVIQLKFTVFDLEFSTNCHSDYVEIYDSRLIGKFCGTESPRMIISSGNSLLIKFHSDRSETGTGFYATYITGTDLCGGTLTDQIGFIKSPGYPSSYPANRECSWIIKADVGNVITLSTNNDFEIEASANCTKDYVKFYDGDNAGGKLLGTMCGIASSRTFQTKSRYLFIQFKTDSNIEWKGFQFSYQQGCTFYITDRKGTITSPGYPLSYPANKNCRWIFSGYQSDTIKITSQEFSLEYSFVDCPDYVEFSSAERITSTKHCGDVHNVTYVGRGRVVMRLVTDESISGRGFKMDYVYEGCSQDFTSEAGTFNTPNYPNNYPSNGFCMWRIRVPEGKKIELKFLEFDLEDHRDRVTNKCKSDYVSVYNGYDTSAPILGTYCSKKPQFHITSTGNQMTVWFKSSFFENRKGFNATYNTSEGGCGGILIGSHGTLHSPNISGNYPPHSLCHWTIKSNSSQRIQITIRNFHLENSNGGNCKDYLEVTDGKTFATLGKFCGRVKITTLTSSGNSINIKFFSDAQNGGKAFSIDYKTVCGGAVSVGNTPGYLTSPHYPFYYEKGECEWLLTAQPGKQIHLQFVDFSVEACERCECDSLTVRDGSTINSTKIGTFCGNNLPSNKISSGNNLHLTFKTDFYQHQHGFKIKYSTDISSCGGYLKSISGVFVSPLHPSKSPTSADCVWIIEVAQSNVVELFFNAIKLGSVCDSSFIKVFDGKTTGDRLIKRICTTNSTESFKSSSNFLTVQFSTRVSTLGFEATYSTGCSDRVLTATSGIIESPGYPNFYGNNMNCKWSLSVPEEKVVVIEVLDFDVEPAPIFSCVDYFAIVNGETQEETSLQYCSNVIPNILKSAAAKTDLVFYSDGDLSRHGFKLKYQIDDRLPDCGANLIATSELQYITTTNFPLNYPPNYYCKWDIKSNTPGRSVKLQFTDFQLEEDENCLYDYVIVETGTLVPPPVALCGETIPSTPFISDGDSIIVKFNSDLSFNYNGFKASFQTVCASTHTDTIGTIKSEQGSDSMYAPNTECTWTIKHEAAGVIMVQFNKFKLQSSTNCTKDYVIIRNGVANDSQILGRYCGSQLPENITSTNHEITITFVTDSEINDSGFELSYKRQAINCGGRLQVSEPGLAYELTSPGYPLGLPSNIECEWTLNAPEGSVIELEFNRVNFSSPTSNCISTHLELNYHDSNVVYRTCGTSPLNRRKFRVASSKLTVKLMTGNTRMVPPGFSMNWKIACGAHFMRGNGNFTSRNYPSGYPGGEDCMYTIELLEKNKQVQLHFPKFRLQEGANDYIKVYDSSNITNLIGTYTGSTVPNSIVSSSHVMTVQFVSDSATTQPASGNFLAEYSTVGTECGGSLNGQGVISTPYFPSNYPVARRCKWKLLSRIFAVELNITDLDIAYSVNCTQDYLLVRNGDSDDSPIIGRYCGQNKAKVLYSTGFYMTLEFVSNRDNNRGKGFRAQFKSNHPACGGEIVGDSGTLISPNYPKNYPNAMECVWKITAKDKHNIIQMRVQDLDIERHRFCGYDHLEIRGGSTEKSPLVNKLCGTYNNDDLEDLGVIAITGPNVYLKFTTDARVTRKGFNITWVAKQPQCGGNLHGSMGEIKSPGYPNSYTLGGHTDCFWIGDLPDGKEVVLNVTFMQIPQSTNCTKDKIIIQNGKEPTSPVIATLCGNLNGPLIFNTSGSHFRVHMISDESGHTPTSMYKFKITYHVKEIGCGGMISANEGIVTSPGFPTLYSGNLECEWVVTTDSGTKVLVTVDTLDVRDSCRYDFLELRDGSDVNAPQLGEKLCGRHIYTSGHKTSKNKLYIRFVTDGRGNGKGFKLHFTTGCGGVLKGRRGFASTPNYPLKYPNNQDCRWAFQIHPHFTVTIKEINMNLPPRNSRGQCTDRVEVYVGRNVSSGTLITSLCGSQDIPQYDTHYNEVALRFISDGVNDDAKYNGASASYEAVCGEHIRNSLNGTIEMKPDIGYFNNETCEWIIEFPVGKKISLDTSSFKLETGYPVCRYDYLEIRDGYNSSAPLIGKWCGNFKPPHVQSTGNFIYIKFKTDARDISEGFIINYSEESLACGGNRDLNNNEIESPDYPAPLQPNTACGWRLTVPEGKRINITFTLMALFPLGSRCTELLIIYDSDYPDERYRRTGAICGNRLPKSFITSSNKAFVSFITSSFVLPSTVPRGFKASFEAVTPVCGGVLNANAIEQSKTVSGLPDGTNCEWIIMPPKGQKVSVSFPLFNVGIHMGTYCTSSVIIREKLTIGGTIYCGESSPGTFHGSFESLVLRVKNFTSTDKFTIKFIAREDCDRTYNTSSGLVTSLNYPRKYPHHMNCSLLISAPTGKIVTLYSAYFNIEKPRRGPCRFDELDIYDGESFASARLNNETLCGQLNLPTVQSTGRSILIHFKADSSVSHRGFAFSYTTSSPGVCGGEITGSTGAITTPNYPNYYGDNVNCEWNITVASGKKVRFSVPEFQSEGADDCSNADSIEIFDGMTSSWGKFCGSAVPAPRISTTNKIRVTFKSNGANNDFRGFKLLFAEE